MYLVRTEFIVTPGCADAFEERQAEMGRLRKGQPGYLGQSFLHSYGDPRKYVNNSRWENAQAVWAFGKSKLFADYIKAGSPGMARITRQEGYDGVYEVDADDVREPGDCEVFVDWNLNFGTNADFESSRRQLFELRKKHTDGFVSHRLRRSAGDPLRYLVLQMYRDLAAGRAANSAPEVSAFFRDYPASLYVTTPTEVETYYVIHRMM